MSRASTNNWSCDQVILMRAFNMHEARTSPSISMTRLALATGQV